MTQEYRFSNALNYSHGQLSEMINASFQGYFFSMQMTAEMSSDFWRIHQIDGNSSVIMHDQQGAFVGTARMGVRGKRGWCGGFGIVPQFRGSGASTLLAERMIQVARSSGLETLQLEVLEQNSRAIKLYEKWGFRRVRQLLGLELAATALPSGEPVQLEKSTTETFVHGLSQAWKPFWGGEAASLLTLDAETFALTGSAHGLMLQKRNDNAVIAAANYPDKLTAEELSTFLRYIAGDANKLQVYNEPDNSPHLKRYQRLGFSEFFRQHEMVLKL